MAPRIYRYVFYRLNRFQLRRIRDPMESALTTILVMCLSPFLVFDLLELLVAQWFGVANLYERFGKWVYGLVFYGVLYLLHYQLLIRDGRATTIMKEFDDTRSYGLAGGLITFGFFAIPILAYLIEIFLHTSSG